MSPEGEEEGTVEVPGESLEEPAETEAVDSSATEPSPQQGEDTQDSKEAAG